MTAYAVGLLRNVRPGPDIVGYLDAIDATLAPFAGRFIIHGGEKAVLEGAWSDDLIVIAFPDTASAHAWYGSPAYRAILRLRTDHSEADVIIIDGVGATHKAPDVLKGGAPA